MCPAAGMTPSTPSYDQVSQSYRFFFASNPLKKPSCPSSSGPRNRASMMVGALVYSVTYSLKKRSPSRM